ncbi:MAG: polysaccharide pyruvyl transferase family protein [Longimicrobiales bacterium]
MMTTAADEGGLEPSGSAALASRPAMSAAGGVRSADPRADGSAQGPIAGARLSAVTGGDVAVARPAAAVQRPARILILGGDSDLNLGDRAILTALCHALAGNGRRVELTVTSATDTLGRLPGVARVLQRGVRGFPALLETAARQDLVIIGSGGLFQDDDSRAKMPYWAAKIAALRAVTPRIAGHAIGAGPLRHPESRLTARVACGLLESMTVRDEFARAWLSDCTGRSLELVPDPAFMLPPAPRAVADDLLRRLGFSPGRPIIGVAVRGWFHRRGGFVPHKTRSALGLARGEGRAAMDGLLDRLAATLRRLARRLDASILLLPTYPARHEGDEDACVRLAARLDGVKAERAVLDDPRLYKAVMGRLSLVISARMHPLILAAGMGVPIVGLAYNGKFSGLFQLLGLPERLLWLDRFREPEQAPLLEAMALDAMQDATDLAVRAEQLAGVCRERTETLVLRAL